jgi:flagellar protein FliO/FliZ
MKWVVVLVATFGSTVALAADSDPLTDGSGMLRALLGLALVLALIGFAGWLLRRIGPQRIGGSGPLRIVASQSLGTRERVVLLEVSDQWLVIGVAPGSVQSLATLPRGVLPTSPAGGQPAFATLLTRALGRGKSDNP